MLVVGVSSSNSVSEFSVPTSSSIPSIEEISSSSSGGLGGGRGISLGSYSFSFLLLSTSGSYNDPEKAGDSG